MSTLFAEINRFRSLLGNLYDSGEANSITNLVFEELFHIPQIRLKLTGELEIKPEEKLRLDSILERLLGHEPVQYVLGFAWFMDERFLVNESTLIPRPETEELVSWIIDEWKSRPEATILDLGTGSGCIGISLVKRLPDARLLAIDKSEAAIHTARINAQQLLKDPHHTLFLVQDMLDPEWWEQQVLFDLIVSNPPYVREQEKGEMAVQVLDYEPPLALFVPDTDPLLYYGAIAELAKSHLTKNGQLFFEINAAFGADMQEMLASLGYKSEVRRDMQGKDRMVKAWLHRSES
ncbi:MAG TPA: peptide chain release factor N(5)-glutamine methyltransferase [Bacteroidetes bacterium]|nr:peptide chain release factor N(5)-glutamine methyltransferase [Bacteroidota bacterium]